MPTKIQQIQDILGVPADNAWGPKSQAALNALIHPQKEIQPGEHDVLASSFADPADISAFKKCKLRGGSDQDCFKVGDNGVGCWGDDVTTGEPACALPPDDMEDKWGSVAGAKHKRILVRANGREVVCVLKDRMPRRANIKNGCGIDLAPVACEALGLKPPFTISATWRWV